MKEEGLSLRLMSVNPSMWKAIGGKDGISKDMSYHMSRDMPSMASMASIAKHGNLHGIK